MPAIRDSSGFILNTEALTSAETAGEKAWCPACHEKTFTMWPGGWDGHAGWKCRGLVIPLPKDTWDKETIESRKREFRQRFSYLFR